MVGRVGVGGVGHQQVQQWVLADWVGPTGRVGPVGRWDWLGGTHFNITMHHTRICMARVAHLGRRRA